MHDKDKLEQNITGNNRQELPYEPLPAWYNRKLLDEKDEERYGPHIYSGPSRTMEEMEHEWNLRGAAEKNISNRPGNQTFCAGDGVAPKE